jgi:hypothetical protein
MAKKPVEAVPTEIVTTMRGLVDAEAALRRVADLPELSPRAIYHVAKMVRLVGQETRHFYERRNALIKQYGIERDSRTPDERRQGPKVTEVAPGAMKEFASRIEEELDVPVTVPWSPVRSVDVPGARARDLADMGPLCDLVEPT